MKTVTEPWDYAANPWQYIAVLGDNYRSETVGELGGFTTAGKAVDAAIAVLGKPVGEVAALPNADWTTDLPAAVVTGFTIERYDGIETDGSWSLNGGLKQSGEASRGAVTFNVESRECSCGESDVYDGYAECSVHPA